MTFSIFKELFTIHYDALFTIDGWCFPVNMIGGGYSVIYVIVVIQLFFI